MDIRFVSINGQITGYPCNGLFVLDDLVKSAAEARSATVKKGIADGYRRNVMTREAGHMSVVVCMTRWAVDDIFGTLQKEKREAAVIDDKGDPVSRPDCAGAPVIVDRWTTLNFEAVCTDKEKDPLHRDVGAYLLDFQKDKVDEARASNVADFYAMYQGTPIVPGLRIFDPPQDVV